MAVVLLIMQAAMAVARGAPETFADLAEEVSPSVVNITTSTTVSSRIGGGPIVPEGSPFEEFFREFNDRSNRGERAPQRNQALGSGFVISEDGFIVTNNHVIEGADEILVEFFSGEELPAVVVGTDVNTDIAVLKVESETALPFVSFGDSDIMRVGDWVLAVGNPLGQGFSVSAGIISARNRELSGTYDDFLQTDAAINRGNSGGPLFNMDGNVIGVNTAILSPNGGSIGIGFSMSSAVVTRVVDQLREFGETRRGWLGVRIQDVGDDVAEALGLSDARGALVSDVPAGPAEDGGILAGDVILSFDGTDVQDTSDLVRQVGNSAVGQAVRVVVFRDGGTQTLLVTLGRRETAEAANEPAASPDEPVEPSSTSILGLELSEITDEMREQLGFAPNVIGLVVMDVDPDSDAASKGVQIGDLVTEVGQRAIATTEAFEGIIAEAREAGRKSVLLLIQRDGDPRFVALPLN
ncbi:Do family serine endopeptidase [Cochlodiniinecator piscidefendens]|uniref:Do family serine endopeptidase n=1 Tax=Cochlodiniinecator piscidefendens TaxID=2715756 RepID=UPI00140BAF42|nr:Do family serine endopeptidase [Cochlodiniinecator piscidefendens]